MSPPPPLIFLIVSPSSNPLYSASFLTQPGQKTSGGVEREGYCQFLLHGGMDMVEHYKVRGGGRGEKDGRSVY